MSRWLPLLFLLSAFVPGLAEAAPGVPAVTVTTNAGGGQDYTVTLQILALMTALTVLPGLLLTMTSFTRIIIVLAILRQALGTAQTPGNQILVGISLLLTLFIMMPVFERMHTEAVQPYLEEKLGAREALQKAQAPLREFMLRQTREPDIEMFARISGQQEMDGPEDVPFTLLMSAFVTSELKTAFQIGFLLFLPFLVIDLVVASILMSMGMMMLSPVLISLPFKLMLFVLVDGWALILEMLAASFYVQ
ncbi:MAG TPA: flagellar type III secretion system pore protein FliP [Methylococcaceae bacterium]|nr:flagellar type III secretion system pore protein FliP [Methylococcaceae bacterium]